MSTWIRILDRIVISVGVSIITLRIGRIRHNRIRRDEPAHQRHVVPRVHVNQPQVVAGVVHPVAGVAAVADARIDRRCRGGAVAAVGVVAGVVAVDPCAVGLAQGMDAALPVGEDKVERAGLPRHLHPRGDELPGQGEGDAPG